MEFNEVQIRYLLTLLHLHGEGEIRSVDLTKELSDSGAVVHKRLEPLIAMGLITKKKYRSIQLTGAGLAAAHQLKEQYEGILPFFSEILQLRQQEARESALSVLGTLSRQCVQRLLEYTASFLEHGETCLPKAQ